MDDTELHAYGFERTERLRFAVNTGDVVLAMDQFNMYGDIERVLTGEQAAKVWTLLAGELVCYIYDLDLAGAAIEVNQSLTPLFRLYEQHGRSGEFFMLLEGELGDLQEIERTGIRRSLCSAAAAAALGLNDDDFEDSPTPSDEGAPMSDGAAETPAALGTIHASDGSSLQWDESRQAYIDGRGEEWVVHDGALMQKWYAEAINTPPSARDQRRNERRIKKLVRRKLR